MNIRDIFKMVSEKELVLPDFQRDYIWSRQEQKELIISVLLSLPVGSLLILDGNKGDFVTKKIGVPDEEEVAKQECKYLLDGQQRITTLKYIFSDQFDNNKWEDSIRSTYKKLRIRWFLRINNLDNEPDIFGYQNLRFDPNSLKKEEPIVFERRLTSEAIGITKSKEWYNPGYKCLSEEENKKDENAKKRITSNKISKCAVSTIKEKIKVDEEEREIEIENYVVPLYSIYNVDCTTKPLYEHIIDRIGDLRKSDLKSECGDDKEKLKQYLYEITDEIEQYIDDSNKEKIDDGWSKLAEKWKVDMMIYLNNILSHDISSINLPSDEIGRAVIVFERINKGGTKLHNYDLVVARAARDENLKSLNTRIKEMLNEEVCLPESITNNISGIDIKKLDLVKMDIIKDNEIINIVKNQYLNLLSIVSNIGYEDVDKIDIEFTKKERILNLTSEQININTENVIKGLKRAISFLCMRCGIIKLNNISYELMLLPLAYTLISDDVWDDKSKINKLEYWYWGSILSGQYMDNQNQKCIEDIKNVYKWIQRGEDKYKELKSKVLNVRGYCDKEILMNINNDTSINSNIHKTILQYILSNQPKDLLEDICLEPWKINIKDWQIHDHHIIPLKEEAKLGDSTNKIRNTNHILNSTMNRVYILASSNNKIKDYSPDKYLKYVNEDALRSNLIDQDLFKDIHNKHKDKSQEIKYKEIFESRFNKLKDKLKDELDKLYKS